MGGIIDAIIDIIKDIIDIILDIINLLIDALFKIIDVILAALANLLGFDDQILEQFEVHNQPLFSKPDKSNLTQIIYDSIMNNEDMVQNILYGLVFQSGKKNIKQFVKLIDDGDYFESYPAVEANVTVVDYDEVDTVLTALYSTPITIASAVLSALFVPNWIKFWLQENKSYNFETGTIIHNNVQYNIDVYASTYNSSGDTYTLKVTNPVSLAGNATLTVNGNTKSIALSDNFAIRESAHTHLLEGLARGGNGETFNISTVEVITDFVVPPKPSGLHYIVYFYKDSTPNTSLIWIYKVGAGTYSNLDDPSAQFGTSGGLSLDVLPAIPLRINNTNFNATSTTKSAQITALTKKVGIDAGDTITSVLEDVASAGVSNHLTKVDHVFLNFGVRLWETSQVGINYCFRFLSILYPGQAVTEGNYNAAPDDKTYNTLIVTGSDYKYAFTFAYIKFAHYSLAQVNASSSSHINAMYYSDLSRFASGAAGNNDLINTYYVSSGQGGYNVGFFCSTTADIAAFLAGTLTQQTGYTSEAANWMQPTQRLSFTGTLLNPDDSNNSDIVIRPVAVYEKINSTTLRLVNKASEETTQRQEITYYQCVANGLNSYTIKAPKSMLKVVDSQTTKFKLVTFNLAEKNDLMFPFSYEMIKDLPNSHVSSLFAAAAHVSIYVADVQVIELPFWAKLLKIIQVVLFIMGMLAAPTIAALFRFLVAQVIRHVITKLIMTALSKLSPELQILAMVAMVYLSGGLKGLDWTKMGDIVLGLSQIATVLGKALEIYAGKELEDLNEEERRNEIQRQKDMDPLYELYKALFIDKDGVSLNLLESSTRNSVLFIKAEDQLRNEIDDYHTNGTASLEVGNMITGMHTQSLDSY